MKQRANTRLYALDGLRGFAMILVFLNHITPQFLLAAFPFLDRFGVFSSGVTGVSFLFILSGFLMAYLYPQPKDAWGFIQKRYTRIFPLFLTTCAFLFFLSVFPNIFWIAQLIILFVFACTVYLFWVYVVKKTHNETFSKLLFFFFFGLQIIIGVVYIFWIMRRPPIFFQQVLPYPIREAFIGLVNATLTFPLGNYIPMLDGVYWSLAAEVLFYVLYPFLVVPVICLLNKQHKSFTIFFFVALMPFLAGIDILSHHIFVLSALQFSLFYYFATGILLAYLYRKYSPSFEKVVSERFSWMSLLGLFLSIVAIHLFNSMPNAPSSWIRLLFAIPLTFFVASALNTKTLLSKILGSRVLVFVGTVSYSIYLSHSVLIHIVSSLYKPASIYGDGMFILLSIVLVLIIAPMLYFFLERPYFISPRKKIAQATHISQFAVTKGRLSLAGTSIVVVLAVFLAFQSRYNFFSAAISETPHIIVPPTNQTMLSTKTYPYVSFTFRARENNLGIIAVAVGHSFTREKPHSAPMLGFRLIELDSNKQLFSADYVLDEFRGEEFPFGFPAIPNSKGKIYIVNFFMTSASTKEYVTINTKSVKSVYQLNKTSILHSPQQFYLLLWTKLQNVFTNQLAFQTLILSLPFICVSLLLIFF